jgi:hypothetical protein
MPAAKGAVPWNAGSGAGWTDKRGYRWVYVTENGRRVARREHRAILERHFGRKLEPWELVHHKDGNPSNNTIENLEITEWGAHTTEHHTGGRKSEDARRSMEAFALMREQLKREREIKADLLALARQYASECARCGGGGLITVKYEWRGAECDADEQPCDECADIRAVIAKAVGPQITTRGEVMNPPESAAEGSEARNLNTPQRHGSGAEPQGGEAQATQHPAAPSVGDPCPVCVGRIGQSGYNYRCGNCGWLGPCVEWAP